MSVLKGGNLNLNLWLLPPPSLFVDLQKLQKKNYGNYLKNTTCCNINFGYFLRLLYLEMLFQIIVPFLLVTCAFNAIHLTINVPTQSLFLLVLLMSDYMALVSGWCIISFASFLVFVVLSHNMLYKKNFIRCN